MSIKCSKVVVWFRQRDQAMAFGRRVMEAMKSKDALATGSLGLRVQYHCVRPNGEQRDRSARRRVRPTVGTPIAKDA